MALRPEPPRRPAQNSSGRLVAPVEPTSAARLTGDSGRRPDVQAKPTPHLASGSSPNASINAKGSGADTPAFARAPITASEDLEASWVLAGPSQFTSWSDDTTGDPEEETVIVDIDEIDEEVAPPSTPRRPSEIGRRPSDEARRGRSTDVVEIVHVHDVRVSSVTALPTYAPPPPPPAPLPNSARLPVASASAPGRRDGPVTAADLDALEARMIARLGPALHEALSKERRALKEQRTQLARAAAQLEKQKKLLEAERKEIAAERDAAATEKALRRRRSGLSSSGLARLRRA